MRGPNSRECGITPCAPGEGGGKTYFLFYNYCAVTNVRMVPNAKAPERRKSPRHQVAVAGTITLSGGETLSCVVMDISTRGARIRASSKLPNRFLLKIRSTALGLGCHVLWRHGDDVGVRFGSA